VRGVVTGQALYPYSERRTVKARTLAADPRLVAHLESGDDVVIVRGMAQNMGLLSRFLTWSQLCRRNTPARTTGSIYAIRPQPAIMWRLLDGEDPQRRWTS